MSSPNGDRLEDFVEEMVGAGASDYAHHMKRLEPHRGAIEYQISEWIEADKNGDGCSSWRDFRNSLWEAFEDKEPQRPGG